MPQSNYFTILNLYMTDVCSYRAWSVLKHISVYLTKPASSHSPRQIFSWNICFNFCHLHVSPWSHALPPGGASSPGEWSFVFHSGSPWHTLFSFQTVHHHSTFIISINRLPVWPSSTSARSPYLIHQTFGCSVMQKAFGERKRWLKWKWWSRWSVSVWFFAKMLFGQFYLSY